MADGCNYPGGELELFEGAIHWKRYWSPMTALNPETIP